MEKATKNTHLNHLEDNVFLGGINGTRDSIDFLRSFRDLLQGRSKQAVNTSVKWDGAPAIWLGPHPVDKQFFVAKKSLFNKVPLYYTSVKEIKNTKDLSTELKKKFILAFEMYKDVKFDKILQGDFLFSKSDLKTAKIDGENMITFTPNTITYAVPVNSDIGKRIKRARMGIVFHTSYSGKTMKDLKAGFGTVSGRSGISSVFLADAAYRDVSGSAKLTKGELSTFNARIRMAEGSLSKANKMLDEMSKSSSDSLSVGFRLKTFFNYYVRNNSEQSKVKELVRMFRDYYENILQQEIDAVKREDTKMKYRKIMEQGLTFIDRNQQGLYFSIASHMSLQTAKNFLIRKLNQIQSIGHFIRTPDGFRVTNPEGYVAVDRVRGAVKLVDRLEFSRANFNIAKDWVKG